MAYMQEKRERLTSEDIRKRTRLVFPGLTLSVDNGVLAQMRLAVLKPGQLLGVRAVVLDPQDDDDYDYDSMNGETFLERAVAISPIQLVGLIPPLEEYDQDPTQPDEVAENESNG